MKVAEVRMLLYMYSSGVNFAGHMRCCLEIELSE